MKEWKDGRIEETGTLVTMYRRCMDHSVWMEECKIGEFLYVLVDSTVAILPASLKIGLRYSLAVVASGEGLGKPLRNYAKAQRQRAADGSYSINDIRGETTTCKSLRNNELASKIPTFHGNMIYIHSLFYAIQFETVTSHQISIHIVNKLPIDIEYRNLTGAFQFIGQCYFQAM